MDELLKDARIPKVGSSQHVGISLIPSPDHTHFEAYRVSVDFDTREAAKAFATAMESR